jgi:phenylpyruvate tautomerase PptA (4-oxalocrotonate tautomerase family)
MPVVHVHVWEGFGKEKAKTVIQNITKVFVNLGIPSHAVEVIVHEIQKSHEPGVKSFFDNCETVNCERECSCRNCFAFLAKKRGSGSG